MVLRERYAVGKGHATLTSRLRIADLHINCGCSHQCLTAKSVTDVLFSDWRQCRSLTATSGARS
eukprot:1116699-Rhodomonas_salina.3